MVLCCIFSVWKEVASKVCFQNCPASEQRDLYRETGTTLSLSMMSTSCKLIVVSDSGSKVQQALSLQRDYVNDILSSFIFLLPLPHKQIVWLYVELLGDKLKSINRTSEWTKVQQQLLDWSHITDCHPTSVYHSNSYMSVYIHGCNWAIFLRPAVTHTKLYPNFPLKRGGEVLLIVITPSNTAM